jgi:hypothetical protein
MNLKLPSTLALGATALLLACGSHYENRFETVTVTRATDNLVTVAASVSCHTVGVNSCSSGNGLCVEARFGTFDPSTLDAGATDAGLSDAGVADAGQADAGAGDAGVDYLIGVQIAAQETVTVCHGQNEGTEFVITSKQAVPTTNGAVELFVNSQGGSPGDAHRVYLVP